MGADRVIFGSDWPHIEGMPQPLDYATELKEFDDDTQQQILRDNARELNNPPSSLVKFSVVGTDHLHVVELVSGLVDAGSELVAIVATEAAHRAVARIAVPGRAECPEPRRRARGCRRRRHRRDPSRSRRDRHHRDARRQGRARRQARRDDHRTARRAPRRARRDRASSTSCCSRSGSRTPRWSAPSNSCRTAASVGWCTRSGSGRTRSTSSAAPTGSSIRRTTAGSSSTSARTRSTSSSPSPAQPRPRCSRRLCVRIPSTRASRCSARCSWLRRDGDRLRARRLLHPGRPRARVG